MRWVLMRAHRQWLRPHQLDPQYEACVRAVRRHFMAHDTLNIKQLERLLDISGMIALRYLDQLVRDQVLRMHGHRGVGAFYTRVLP